MKNARFLFESETKIRVFTHFLFVCLLLFFYSITIGFFFIFLFIFTILIRSSTSIIWCPSQFSFDKIRYDFLDSIELITFYDCFAKIFLSELNFVNKTT